MKIQEPPASNKAPSIEAWLKSHRPDSSLFASPYGSLMAHGTSIYCRADNQYGTLPATIANLLAQAGERSHTAPIVLGAIPFNPARPGFFRVPKCYSHVGPLAHSVGQQKHALSDHHVLKHHLIPSAAQYESLVKQALELMSSGGISKLVLARQIKIELDKSLDRQTVLRNMLHSNRSGYTYAIVLDPQEHPDPETFLGASPELLLRLEGEQVFVNPLAGTCARDPRPDHDQSLAQGLLNSRKDRHEHELVVADVVRILRHYCTDLVVPAGPSLTSTRNLWHLSTRISARLRDPGVSSLQLALAMHPTPAVCGTPTELAMRTIENLEPFERGFFAGAVGWCDHSGNGEWAVAIRCAHYQHRSLTLSAGAGIVPDSVPALESLETGNKLMTLLGSLGLQQAIDTL